MFQQLEMLRKRLDDSPHSVNTGVFIDIVEFGAIGRRVGDAELGRRWVSLLSSWGGTVLKRKRRSSLRDSPPVHQYIYTTSLCQDKVEAKTEPRNSLNPEPKMGKQASGVLYVVLMAATVVAVDLLFFRKHFWERLTVNIGIILVFAAFYFRFLKRP